MDLRAKGKRYRQHKGVDAGARLIPDRVNIDERPGCVDLNEEVGHWGCFLWMTWISIWKTEILKILAPHKSGKRRHFTGF